MTIFIRRLIQIALGLAAGLAAWPVLESLAHFEVWFAGYLAYTVVSGALFGLLFGAFLGCADGIIASRSRRIVSGATVGGIVGAIGGALGFLLGQGLLFLSGEYLVGNVHRLQSIALPAARAGGWAVLGAFVGAASGVRSFSFRKIAIGALGGFIGGIVGGAVVEYGRVLFPSSPFVHLVALIGIAYAFVEKRLSFGILRVLNGPFKSREFILNQRRLVVGSRSDTDIPIPVRSGSSEGASIPIAGYRDVAPTHCRLVAKGRDLFIEQMDGIVRVNDERLSSETGKALKFDDVVACGSVKFLYKRE